MWKYLEVKYHISNSGSSSLAKKLQNKHDKILSIANFGGRYPATHSPILSTILFENFHYKKLRGMRK